VARLPLAIALPAAVKLGAHLATANRYGYHRDELYFIAASDRLAWGFVDFPPVTPVVTWVGRNVFGDTLFGVRVIPALVGAAVVVLTGLIARRLGAGPFGQALACTAVLASAIFLGGNGLLSATGLDQLTGLAVTYLFLRLLESDDARWWLALGAGIGVAVWTKYTVLFLVFGLAVGLLATPGRRWLRTPWPWLGTGIAVAMIVPNLVWQVRRGWPTLEFFGSQGTSATAESSVFEYLLNQVLLPGPLALPVLVVGVVWLFRDERFRALGWMYVAVFVVVGAVGGKSYYVAPLYPVAFAAGAVVVERAARGWRRAAAAGVVVSGLASLPIGLPVLPPDTMVAWGIGEARADFPDMFGWPELARTVDAVAVSTGDPDAIALARNYGEAAAIERFGVTPVISTHNAYFFWRPDVLRPRTVVAVGYSRERLSELFGDVQEVATVTNDAGIDNVESGRAVYVCREPIVPLGDAWDDLKLFTA